MISFGICTKNISVLQNSKCDYAELSFTDLAQMPQADFDALQASFAQAGIRVYSCNGALFGGVMLAQEDDKADFGLSDYMNCGFSRLQALGGKILVVGSGTARRYAEGENAQIGMDRFARFLKFACKIAAPYGIRVVIEPLNQKESNIVFTVLDGYRVCELAGFPENLGVLADLYHVAQEEPISDILKVKDRLWHCHIAAPSDRKTPLPEDGSEAACQEMLSCLKQIGYTGGISLECVARNGEADFAVSIAYLKELLEKA